MAAVAAAAAAAAPFLPLVLFPLAAGVSPPLPLLSPLLPLAWLPQAGVADFVSVAGVTAFAGFPGEAGLVEGPALNTSGADLRGAGQGQVGRRRYF